MRHFFGRGIGAPGVGDRVSEQAGPWAERHWKSWYFWATHSRLDPVIDAARTLKRHLSDLLSYFAHPITNAGAEGLNSRIQALRVSARGRNRENFKAAIYFHRGGLDLYPQTH